MQEAAFSKDELSRYARHLIMPEVSAEGQRRLKNAAVLCLGAGGLGSPAAMYLAAAGVGRLGLVDDDAVDLSNLQRQLLHGTSDIDRPKVESARARLHEINPEIAVQTYPERFTRENAHRLIDGYDIVLDGSDNFATRYLSNDVCVFAGKPNIYGSVFRFEGQATVFAPHLGGPCYRCLFPDPPEPGSVPNCAEAGVLGVLPGIIGSIQALEAIKLILGKGESLVGRLVHFDAMKMRFREFALRRDPACPVCGDDPTIRELVDYEQLCSREDAVVPELNVHSLKARLGAGEDIVLLDVREPQEFEIARLDSAKLIPLRELPARVDELDRTRETIVYCKSGARSAHAVEWLRENGFENTWNLVGGIDAWAEEIDPSLPRY